jgi:hypothetical protein
MGAVIDNYLDVQQDILETFVDRGQLRKLSEPTVMKNGKRIPGLKIDHPRQLAVMHALVRLPTSPLGVSSILGISIAMSPGHSVWRQNSTHLARSATTCQSFELLTAIKTGLLVALVERKVIEPE